MRDEIACGGFDVCRLFIILIFSALLFDGYHPPYLGIYCDHPIGCFDSARLANRNPGRDLRKPCVAGICVLGQLAATRVAGGPVLLRGVWFDSVLIHSSAELLR